VKDFSPAYGIVPPLITTFDENKQINYDTYERLIEWHIARGVTGLFVVCGSSEYFALEEDEAIKMAETAVRVAGDRINILAGSTIYEDVDKNIAMTKRMADTGVKGCFITTPREVPAEDDLMLEYHRKIHDAVDCPVYAYEMPGGTNYKFSAEAFAELGRWDRFIGIKDTTCNVEMVKAKIEAAKGTILIMEANTPNMLETLQLGAVGGINTSANVEPALFAKFVRLVDAGKIDDAEALHKKIIEIDSMMWGYPLCCKIAVAMMGVPEIKPVMRNKSREFTPDRIEGVKKMVEIIEQAEKDFDVFN
jgi:4-hydroxy-tetrahydrodipicolinate synthase